METLGVGEQYTTINGIVEVEVGTARDACANITNGSANGTTLQDGQLTQTNRRQSVMSSVSLLSLPPAYSQLHTRSGSMVSLETCMLKATIPYILKTFQTYFLPFVVPPRYDEVKNN